MEIKNSLHVKDRDRWRAWLSENHDKATEVWLLFYKKHTGQPCVSYNDAVEEALCFGWIDSIIKRIDNEKYARKFTPRQPVSQWSRLNVQRTEKMISENKMTHAGLKLYTYARDHKLLPGDDERPEKTFELPELIVEALNGNKKAQHFFSSLAPSYQRQYVGWIMDAKKEETRLRRLDEVIGLLSEGKKLGLK